MTFLPTDIHTAWGAFICRKSPKRDRMKKEMLINVKQPEECRIAIVEDGILEELYVERTSHESYTGNIYKGRVVNLEPAIQAAFVVTSQSYQRRLPCTFLDIESQYYRPRPQPASRYRAPRASVNASTAATRAVRATDIEDAIRAAANRLKNPSTGQSAHPPANRAAARCLTIPLNRHSAHHLANRRRCHRRIQIESSSFGPPPDEPRAARRRMIRLSRHSARHLTNPAVARRRMIRSSRRSARHLTNPAVARRRTVIPIRSSVRRATTLTNPAVARRVMILLIRHLAHHLTSHPAQTAETDRPQDEMSGIAIEIAIARVTGSARTCQSRAAAIVPNRPSDASGRDSSPSPSHGPNPSLNRSSTRSRSSPSPSQRLRRKSPSRPGMSKRASPPAGLNRQRGGPTFVPPSPKAPSPSPPGPLTRSSRRSLLPMNSQKPI